MPKVESPTAFLRRLKKALANDLKEIDIPAKVGSQRVPGTKLHRVMVLAPKFKALRHTERQDLVWRIAEKTLSWDEQLRISMIVTLTPDEADGR